MSKKATEFQKKEMSKMYRGKEIFKPLNTGWIDENMACVREWVANIFFYRKGDTTIMIDAGYNYDRLAEKMGWLGIDPASIRHILITHQDTDHVGAVEADSPGLFKNAKLYIGEVENRYLTGEVRRKVIYRLYKLPQVTINNEKVLLHDGEVFDIDGIKIECFLVPGHTWGHMVYLIDDKYLFTGDTIWFGADGGYSFISSLAEDNKLAVQSLAELERKLRARGLHPYFITGHTGWTDNLEFAFAHRDKLCSPFKKRVHDPSAPYKTDGDLKKLRRNTVYLGRVIDANIEGYRAIRNAGHDILPKADADFESEKYRKTCLRFFKLMCATSLGKLCASDHAMNAIDEMSALNRDIKRFFDENGAAYPVWQALEAEAGRYLR